MRKGYDLLQYAKVEGDPHQSLANAIVIVACRDYKASLKKLKNPMIGRQDETFAERDKTGCELFFRSGLFQILTNLNPEQLIKDLQAEVYGPKAYYYNKGAKQ